MSVESLTKLVCVEDFHKAALEVLPKNTRDYYESGAEAEETLRDNEAAFSRVKLRTRVLRDVSTVDLSTIIFDRKLAFPVGIAPSAMQRLAHPDGELATARAAALSGSIMVLSTYATTSLEDVIAEYNKASKVYASLNNGVEAPGMWFQLYVYQNRSVSESLIRRAEKAGYRGLMVTVDTPVLGRRLNDQRNSFVSVSLPEFALPPHLTLANFDPSLGIRSLSERTAKAGSASVASKDGLDSAKSAISMLQGSSPGQESIIGQGNTSDASMSWERDVPWLKKTTTMKVILKGILSGEDAVLAAKWGVDAIVISNHGGRQLDTVPSTLDSLTECHNALSLHSSLNPEAHIPDLMMDGGVRKGTDVVKALALGAKMVFVGRPALWGLAQGGEDGVRGVMGLLREEVRVAMTLLGCRNVGEVRVDRVSVLRLVGEGGDCKCKSGAKL
ncbi:Hydroxyacid oxidase 1 [Dinochytrium kinnereticum]|nr:Hydroxyacid oxidase 1 [Dinochytrium kinnereticum]